jgi:two-component system cell cycle response regulator DivK
MNRRILVVDDHPVNRKLATMLLGGAGYPIEEAASGEEALARLATGGFDAVLLDVSMPGLSGSEVCARIRADPELRPLRVVAYTAHAFEDECNKILAAGFDALVTKPVSRNRLLAAVDPQAATA